MSCHLVTNLVLSEFLAEKYCIEKKNDLYLQTNKKLLKRNIDLKEFLITQSTGIYTFKFQNKTFTEFDEFMHKFKNSGDELIIDDFNRIIKAIQKISESGALARYFRPERKIKDNVVAIPLDIKPRKNHPTLRLYCLRLSDHLIIIGNGDTKFQKYNNNPLIVQYTEDLASLEQAIKFYKKTNDIKLNHNRIVVNNSINIEI